MNKEFQPVIIGTDINSYNVARAFHMAHGVVSKVFGNMELIPVKHSKIVDTTEVEGFYKDDVMVDTLVDYAKANADKDLILFAASENYVHRIFSNYDILSDYYIIPYISPDKGLYYSDKMNFYKVCEEKNFPYPKAQSVNRETYKDAVVDLDFPLILKPIESSDYFELNFEGKEKAYILEDEVAYEKAIMDIYNHGYGHDMVLQEFVPGPVTNEYVLNVYSDSKGKVRLLSLGQIILDHPDSALRGNYLAIASPEKNEATKKLYKDIQIFLEDIEFKGLANFDFKWDENHQTFKVFDFNLRQGRSSFFSVVAGANYAISVIDDLQDNPREIIYGDKEFIWLDCTEDFLHETYAELNPEKYAELKDIKNVDNTLEYKEDNSFLRKRLIKKYLKNNDERLKNKLY